MKKYALITGASVRIGRAIAQTLHQDFDIVIHHNQSQAQAQELQQQLNAIRPESAHLLQADLAMVNDLDELHEFIAQLLTITQDNLQVLVNNASSFYPTDLRQINHEETLQAWDDLFLTNAKAPFILSQLLGQLIGDWSKDGSIISILDIHANGRPFVGHSIYSMAKSAHQAMVHALALEFAPNVRVNGVSPGVNIFPDTPSDYLNDHTKQALTDSIPLGKIGTPQDIAHAVHFLVKAPYITGQILAVDGGRSLTLKGG